ncbi:MAG: sigma-70 family RNA polymerase sigma factor [Acidobacteriota bacterium]|nr:sigma-70 family RNA polymerase sigma factor [Acidobacteriota bacterium]
MRGDVEQALEFLQQREPAAVEKALALLQDTVFSFSIKVCGHTQDAGDTAQDALLKSIPHLAKFDNPKALTVWLYKVARNHCISQHRRPGSLPARNLSLDDLMPDRRELQDLLRTQTPNPEAALLNSKSAEHLKQSILQVPPQYRMVLVLHDMEDLSTSEVAQIMGLREGTVRVRLHRARLLVRRHIANLSRAGRVLHAGAEEAKTPRCRRLFAALSDYIDGVIDDAMCDEMDLHLDDCQPCQAFLASLKNAVSQCRSYRPACDAQRAEEIRRRIVPHYQQAVAALAKSRPAVGSR